MTLPLSKSPTEGYTKIEEPLFDPSVHLAAIVDASDDAIISKDLSGTILSWNAAAARIFGYSANEIVGHSIRILIPPELHVDEDRVLARVRFGERIEHHETIEIRKNGQRFPVSSTISPVRNVAGQIVGASEVVRDISERTKSESTRFQLAAIVDSADDAIVSKDLNGIVKTWNQGAGRMFGYSEEEMIGQPILRLIPDDLKYEEDEILRKLRAGERIDHYDTVRVKKSGERFDVSVTISPIKNASGQVIGASKFARDISDRKRIERLLIQSEKIAATGRMAATVAHEINNPLESLMNLIYLARKESPPEGKAHKHLTTAERELERVAHIARQTLGYYRDTGIPTELHLHELIENVLDVYKAKLNANDIATQLDFSDIQKISVSRGELLQILSNIITNAIDAMQYGGTLQITTRKVPGPGGHGIQTTIRDSGTGIPQENLERIFEPFYTTKGSLGTGIGLWIARQLTTRRGGQITVNSCTEKGKNGTAVTIFIPFAAPPQAPSSLDQ